MTTRTLVFVLGDQLAPGLNALATADRRQDLVFMCEVDDETRYVRHHKKKIAFVLAAMRAFAAELRTSGWRVDYVPLDDPENTGRLDAELCRAVARHRPANIVCTEAGEHRVRALQRSLAAACGVEVTLRADDRFLCSSDEFATWAQGRSTLRMEYFYREMRRRTGLLMTGAAPVGGRWNFDVENRRRPPASLVPPQPLHVSPDAGTRAVLDLVARRCADHFGDLQPFWLPVTRADAERAATQFFAQSLPHFGAYQDAMLSGHSFLYHSVLAPLINVGLLDPLALCRRAEAEYHAGRAPLNSVEGFIRQIIGWREFVRGIYFWSGPDYVRRNALGATRPLPAFYWTTQTRMACMAAALGQTKAEAYAHHIQRLMVTGNFALLAGIAPHAVHEWYLAVYADAYEWVEAPNTIGMSQFADGGLFGSKPYASTGAYIDRMSDYCMSCWYRVREKTGARSCPFNALYWDFLVRHRARFESHPRMRQMYRTYDRIDPEIRAAIAVRAADILARLDGEGREGEDML